MAGARQTSVRRNPGCELVRLIFMKSRVANHTIQRMRASHLAQSEFGSRVRLARTADGER
jgi:hypothetical protein